jgi:hypothetical protein
MDIEPPVKNEGNTRRLLYNIMSNYECQNHKIVAGVIHLCYGS